MNKTALVTGGNRGIGLEICRQLLSKNIHVLLGSRNAEKGKKALAKLDSDFAEAIELDVTNPSHLSRIEEYVRRRPIDILVNNAGIAQGRRYSVLSEPEEMSRATMETNFWGAWNLSKIILRSMKERKSGRIVNVSSGLGTFDKMESDNPGYRISKVALNALTVLLDNEVCDYDDILINAMAPGWVRTHLGGINAERSVGEGADTAVWLCFIDRHGPRGKLLKDRMSFPW